MFIIALIIYSAIEFLLTGEPNIVRSYTVGFIEYMILPFLFITILYSYIGESEESFIRVLLITSCVGAVITLLCIFSPEIDFYIRYNVTSIAYGDDSRSNTEYRGFGISEALTYSYGIIQAMLCCIGLFYYKKQKWFLPWIIIVFISALLNARTGIIISITGFFLFAKHQSSFMNVLFIMLPLALLFLHLDSILIWLGVGDRTIEWLLLFNEEMTSVFSNKSLAASDTTSYMFDEMFVLPENISEWLFGCGYDIYYSKTKRTDLGWLLQLNFGGLPYFLLILAFLRHLYKRYSSLSHKNIATFLMLAFIIANTKGPVLPNSGMMRLTMLIYCYFIFKIAYSNQTIRL